MRLFPLTSTNNFPPMIPTTLQIINDIILERIRIKDARIARHAATQRSAVRSLTLNKTISR